MSTGSKVAAAIAVPPLVGVYPLYSYLTSGGSAGVFLMNSDGVVDSAYTSGNFGYEHANYMIHPKKENEQQWDKNFKKITGVATIESIFSNNSENIKSRRIEKAYSDSEDTALNRVCDAIYKEPVANINAPGGDGKYKEDEVWKNCSILIAKPRTISEVTSEDSTYTSLSGSLGNTKKDKLVAVSDSSNFWYFQEERFWGKNLYKFASDASPFKQKRKAGMTEEDKTKIFLNNLCQEEYKKNTSAIESYKKDFWEFCSLTGREG